MIVVCFFFGLFFAASPTEVLVLKNGKTIKCTSYLVENGQVSFKTGKKSYSIPESMVDWERSKEAKRLLDEREAVRAAATEVKKVVEPPARPKKIISLTNEEYHRNVKSYGGEPVTFPYRRMGNSIIVKVSINGRPGLDFILDTGAEITMISPEASLELGIRASGKNIDVFGVGGVARSARLCNLREVSLAGARVRNLQAVIQAIPPLNEARIVGLLGQDFINHFVMNLDPTGNTITLSPHGSTTSAGMMTDDLEEALKNPEKVARDIKRITNSLIDLYNNFQRFQPGQESSSGVQRLTMLASQLPDVQNRVARIYHALTALGNDNLQEEQEQLAQVFLSCYPLYDSHLRELQQFTRSLRSAYSHTGDPAMLRKSQGNLRESLGRLVDSLRRCDECG